MPPPVAPTPARALRHPELVHRPRLVAVDVDHTLIRDDHTLAPATVDAVREAVAAGIEVVLASSRPPAALRGYLLALGLVEPARFVGCQGALVGGYGPDGSLTTVATTPVPLGLAHAVAAAAARAGVPVNWYAGDRWLVDRIDEGVRREAGVVRLDPVVADLAAEREAPLKLLLIAPDAGSAAALRPLLPAGVAVESSNPRYLEVTAEGVGKETGVLRIAAGLGIAAADVVAMGDGPNDLGLFAAVGRSIAPANAAPEVAARADYRTAGNDDDGAAIALRWLTALPEAPARS